MAEISWQHDLALCKHVIGMRLTAFALDQPDIRALDAEPLDVNGQRRVAALAECLRVLQTRHGEDHNWTRAWLMAPSFQQGTLSALDMLREDDPACWQAVVAMSRSYAE